jgi:hypothetical protein
MGVGGHVEQPPRLNLKTRASTLTINSDCNLCSVNSSYACGLRDRRGYVVACSIERATPSITRKLRPPIARQMAISIWPTESPGGETSIIGNKPVIIGDNHATAR